MNHKILGTLLLLLTIIGNAEAQETVITEYSYELAEHLMTLARPSAPEVFDGQVIFTLPSSYRRAGVAFAHENWTTIHWFRKLELPIENTAPFADDAKIPRQFYHDSGIMFTVYAPPPDADILEYRFIADGLWIADPLNRVSRLDTASGVRNSLVYLDPVPSAQTMDEAGDGRVRFRYRTEPGDAVYLAGNFNNWDPFMYEMSEETPGNYTLALGLPAGTYHYVFFQRGEFRHDLANPERVYLLDGRTASVVVVP
ncbi:MAG: glycogen-binding domain-containing protein [Spirochaetaceae bacterium]|jgi:hypothetical protein|nr:glycogen-binding domain-containing protein [Spirochaetaceae bacterium]